MTKLRYSREELLAEHPYARPHEEAGYRLHGGFDSRGCYISPRTLHRRPAVEAWKTELKRRGWPLIDATRRILERDPYPSFEQQRFLLESGYGTSLWNALTFTGIVEARGKLLVGLRPPNFGRIVEENLEGNATGHLHEGLLDAHGLDEGGDSASGLGGHDAMWFAVRDLLFGKDAYPVPTVPASIARPESGRLMPGLPQRHEEFILLLMNVLMIEVRAEAFFDFTCRLARSPGLFRDRREQAELAAVLVDRIRQDETIHVDYLQAVLSELRSFTFRLEQGGTVSGKTFMDPVWEGMVGWHGATQIELARDQTRRSIAAGLAARTDGEKLLECFDALESRKAA